MIRIDKNYVILGNARDYTLALDTHSKDKDNDPIYKTLGYYSTVQAALMGLNSYLQHKSVVTKELSLQETANEFKKIADDLKSHYKQLA